MNKKIQFSFLSLVACFNISASYCKSHKVNINLSHTKYETNLLPTFLKSSSELINQKNKLLKNVNSKIEKLLENKPITFKNSFIFLDDIIFEVTTYMNQLNLYAEIHPDKKLRETSHRMIKELSGWLNKVESSRSIYNVLNSFLIRSNQLKGEDKRLVDITFRQYKRNGFHLPKEKQNGFKKIKEEIGTLNSKIILEMNKENAIKFFITPEEMKGMPKMISRMIPQENNYFVIIPGLKYQYDAIIKNSPNEGLRKKLFIARNSRAKSNKNIIEKLLKQKLKLSNLLGYKSWADYITEEKMTQNAKTAIDFISDLAKKLNPKFKQEYNQLLELKQNETKNIDTKLHPWDIDYYAQKLQKLKYNIDLEDLRKYFEYNKVRDGMFSVYEDLFSLKIEKLTPKNVWHKDVELIKISDAKTGSLLGYLYLDSFPRPDQGKQNNFAMFTLRTSKLLPNGKSITPISALICNFPSPTDEIPSLLTYEHVTTFFHEFGHALHNILSKSKYTRLAGVMVPGDFVEAPSQMLEYWMQDKKVLDRFAENFQDPNDKISQEVLNKIIEANKSVKAMEFKKHSSWALIDLKMHSLTKLNEEFNIVDFSNSIIESNYFPMPYSTSFITSFNHPFAGYDAGYYGYAWADSIAADMASIFANSPNGYMNKKLGLKLRKEIYETGNTREVKDSIEKFLGRKVSNNAFIKQLGIE